MSDALSDLTKPFRKEKQPEPDQLRQLVDFVKNNNGYVRLAYDAKKKGVVASLSTDRKLWPDGTRAEAYVAFIVADHEESPQLGPIFRPQCLQAIERTLKELK